jgi:hypothetical protein
MHPPCPLSVIIPFYDETAFVGMALRSVFAQRIPGAEVILVNDNPGAFSPGDIQDLIGNMPVNVLHHTKNMGLSQARNTGLAAARGAHIAFLDADDYYVNGGLTAQLTAAQVSGACMTHAQTYITRQGSPDLEVLRRDRLLLGRTRLVNGLVEAAEAQFITSSWSSLYRRDFLRANGLAFDPAQRKFEDRLFVLQTVTAARKIAFTGQPARVWRRRAGSISVTQTNPQIHRWQVQLLEKCLTHMRHEIGSGRLPFSFEKKEIFNTISRIIWDMDILPLLAAAQGEYVGFGDRIQALLGDDRLANPLFDDPVMGAISRVGMPTRMGRITRTDFFELHKMLREGAFLQAHNMVQTRQREAQDTQKAPALHTAVQAQITLHLGLHKTGTTYAQHILQAHRERLRMNGICLPQTGLTMPGETGPKAGGFSGHLGLLRAMREGDDATWEGLAREIRDSRCSRAILTCENMSLIMDDNRDVALARLLPLLRALGSVQPIAMIRRADHFVEALYRETVVNGARGGARSSEEFWNDMAPRAADLPGIFAPFEDSLGRMIRLADFDRARQNGGVWASFCSLARLPNLPVVDVPTYPSISREAAQALRMINAMVPNLAQRQGAIAEALTLMPAGPSDGQSALPPQMRAQLVQASCQQSGNWAAARGYAPDWGTMLAQTDAPWTPMATIPQAMLEPVLECALRLPPVQKEKPQTRTRRGVVLRLYLRPWVVGQLDRLRAALPPKRRVWRRKPA